MTETLERLNRALGEKYIVEREIGHGGMATVFLARDIRHERRVALKLLRADLGAVLGVERFLSEIRVTANLQHPNLLPLFDSGSTDGSLFYVMPYVEGESLRHRLEREKQLPVEEAIRITSAIASALDYAHKQGVIHRDLKPENILMQVGQPVIADFGIALAISNAGGARVTQTGLSLGTPQYMSPEQATGDRVIDARTDIYSLGAILYEMLTGEPPHTGSTAQAIIARLLTDQPRAMRVTRPAIPEHIEAAVAQALEKLPADRFASAGEFAAALTRPGTIAARSASPLRTRSLTSRVIAVLPWTLLAALVIAILARSAFRNPEAPSPVVRFQPNIGDLELRADASMAMSPDGSMMVFPASDSTRRIRLWLQSFDRDRPVPFGDGPHDATTPFFSADGRHVAFVRGGRLWRTAIATGTTEVICDLQLPWQFGTWSENDDIVFARFDLYRVRASGGQPQLLVKRDSAAGVNYFSQPHFLPGGEVVLADRNTAQGFDLVAVELATGNVTELGIKGQAAQYVNGGFLVYVENTDGVAYAVPFDARRLRVTGEPVRIIDNVTRAVQARLSVSRNGTMAYYSSVNAQRRDVVLLDRSGRQQMLPLPAGRYRFPRFSPDGRRLTIVAQRPRGVLGDVWTYELATRRADRLTFDSTVLVAEWAPDGRSIYYQTRDANGWVLNRVPASGGTPELAHKVPSGSVSTPGLTPDGRTVIYSDTRGGSWDVYLAPLDKPDSARAIANARNYAETAIALSPDGRWLAYAANPDANWQVYVRRLDARSGRWLVSTSSGAEPRWGANGRELFFRDDDDALNVVSFNGAAETPVIGAPRRLFDGQFVAWPTEVHYDVTRDGQTFVFITGTNGGISMNVVLNRLDALRAP